MLQSCPSLPFFFCKPFGSPGDYFQSTFVSQTPLGVGASLTPPSFKIVQGIAQINLAESDASSDMQLCWRPVQVFGSLEPPRPRVPERTGDPAPPAAAKKPVGDGLDMLWSTGVMRGRGGAL